MRAIQGVVTFYIYFRVTSQTATCRFLMFFIKFSLFHCHARKKGYISYNVWGKKSSRSVPNSFIQQYSVALLRAAVQDPALAQAAEQLGLEELADADVLGEALPAARLEHEVARRGLGVGGLERAQLERLVEGVAGHDLPLVEDEGEVDLTLRVDLLQNSQRKNVTVKKVRKGTGRERS